MTAADTATADTTTYPNAGFDRYYGHAVWELGEDGDQFLVQGHGRRAVAALNAHFRYLDGPRPSHAGSMTVHEGHAVFVRDCGCTAEDHAAGHPRPVEDFPAGADLSLYGDVVDGKVLTDCDCDAAGLPPCGDEWAWVAQPAVESVSALPVLWVRVTA